MRLVAATNRDPRGGDRKGEFRQDLFYRINTIAVTLPPLRERPEDVRVLAEHFIEQFAHYGRKRLTPEALARAWSPITGRVTSASCST
jgi:transcriptional regulator with PAS, ATPase and Fis domain